MAKIHDEIKGIEDDLKKIIRRANLLEKDAGTYGKKQQDAILSFANGLRNVSGWHLGELKNAFGRGIKTKMTPGGKLEVVE